MKILITGVSGNVGSGILEALLPYHELQLSDIAPIELSTENSFFEADVREAGALDKASEGMEIIVHTPAYHGIHMGSRSEQEFYDLNVNGTFNMFQSAVRNQVRRVVWLSSMSFYGTDFYAYTKKIGEKMCQFYHERHGIEVIMLRPADFTPFKSFRQYGERLLHGGVDRRDVIQAAILATECRQAYGAYHIVRQDLFTQEDVEAYAESPIEVWDKIYPGSKAIIESYNLNLPRQIHTSDLSKEQNELGYIPKYHFGTFIQEFTKNGIISEREADV